MIFVLPVEGRNKRAIEPKRKEVKQKKHMWEKKLWIINWDWKFITYEQLERATKRNLEKFPWITEDQAAGREKVTINWETGYLNWDGILCKAA